MKAVKERTKLSDAQLLEEIEVLRKEKNAVILAHYYQEAIIQDIADYLGDSLYLAQVAAKTDADIILFAGVHFMAETAKILNPSKKVILPDLEAGCSLADAAPFDEFKAFVDAHPNHTVVTYINASAAIKTLTDICCTSANAVKVINSIPKDQPIIFGPDKNLGKYLIRKTGREMLLWDGACMVHEAFSMDKLLELAGEHPDAKIIAHPESEEHILKTAHYIGSTSGLLKFVQQDDAKKYLVATEAGILHEMMKVEPKKTFIPVPVAEDNSCACSECHYMKMNTLEKLHACLKNETPEIVLDKEIIRKARLPIDRMLNIS